MWEDWDSIIDVYINKDNISKYIKDVPVWHLIVELDSWQIIDAWYSIWDKGEDGKDGKDGIDWNDGRDGLDWKNGRDGRDWIDWVAWIDGKDWKDWSPDSPEDIVKKLSRLVWEKRLDAKYIKWIENFITGKWSSNRLTQLIDVNVDGIENWDTIVYNSTKSQFEKRPLPSSLVSSVIAGTNISVTWTPTDPIINSLSDRYKTTSTTSQAIVPTWTLTFTVDGDLSYTPQQDIIIAYDASNHMHWYVVSYSWTTLVVSIAHKTGSWTYSSWIINLDSISVPLSVDVDGVTIDGDGSSTPLSVILNGNNTQTLYNNAWVIGGNERLTFSIADDATYIQTGHTRFTEGVSYMEFSLINLTGNRSFTRQDQAWTVALLGWLNNVSEFVNDAGYLTSATGVTSVTGTLNRIKITGTTTPVVDISASYVGQSSITTVGTLTSGSIWAWFTAIANARLANSSITIGSTSISLGDTATTIVGLTSVTSTTFVGALTGNASTATALTTARTIGTITGDATSAGSSFDGSANNTNALTLATVNANVWSFWSATAVGTFTVNAKWLITAASNVTVTPAVGSITGLGTWVATALWVNIWTAWSFVVNGGALGTPSSWVATNLTGLPLTTGITGTLWVTNWWTGTATTFTQGSVIFAWASGIYSQDNAWLFFNDTSNFLGIGTAAPAAALDIAGNISASARTTSGIKIRQRASTVTDTSSSGTVASNYLNVYSATTIAATNVTTYTTTIWNFYQAPIAWSNVTLTNNITSYIQWNGVVSWNLTIGTSISPWSRIYISGNTSQNARTTGGAIIRLASATHTDQTSSWTVATAATVWFDAGAFAATNVTTYTNATWLYIDAPTAGANVTITNPYAIYASGAILATSNLTLWSTAQTSRLWISGALTSSAWWTAGIVIRTVEGTYTDTSTAASGTASSAAMHSFAAHVIAATNTAVTTTTAYNVYIAGAPAPGTNMTIGTSWSLFVNAGRSRFSGVTLAAGSATALTAPIILTTGTVNTVAEAGAFEYTTPTLYFTNGGAQRQEIPLIQQSRVASDVSYTSTTTLANITGLTATLVAGKHYVFEANFTGTSATAGGVKFAIGGTCTATHIRYSVVIQDSGGGITYADVGTALAASVGASNVTKPVTKIVGTITVNAAGTLTVQGAQNSSSGTASVFERWSIFMVREIA